MKCSEKKGLRSFGFVQTGGTTVPDAGWGCRQGKIATERIDLRQLGVYYLVIRSKNGNPGSIDTEVRPS